MINAKAKKETSPNFQCGKKNGLYFLHLMCRNLEKKAKKKTKSGHRGVKFAIYSLKVLSGNNLFRFQQALILCRLEHTLGSTTWNRYRDGVPQTIDHRKRSCFSQYLRNNPKWITSKIQCTLYVQPKTVLFEEISRSSGRHRNTKQVIVETYKTWEYRLNDAYVTQAHSYSWWEKKKRRWWVILPSVQDK